MVSNVFCMAWVQRISKHPSSHKWGVTSFAIAQIQMWKVSEYPKMGQIFAYSLHILYLHLREKKVTPNLNLLYSGYDQKTKICCTLIQYSIILVYLFFIGLWWENQFTQTQLCLIFFLQFECEEIFRLKKSNKPPPPNIFVVIGFHVIKNVSKEKIKLVQSHLMLAFLAFLRLLGLPQLSGWGCRGSEVWLTLRGKWAEPLKDMIAERGGEEDRHSREARCEGRARWRRRRRSSKTHQNDENLH